MSTLPPELELHIFESVAKASPYDAALRLTLMLVARRVQIWVEPLAYHCLVFSKTNSWTRLKRIAESKPPEFLARHVKSICMPISTVSILEAAEILSACTGVERLACWIDHGVTALPQSIPVQSLALSRLSIELSHFLALPAALPSLHAQLTHLELIYWEAHAEHYPATVDLARFPRLTHLALRSDAARFHWPLEMVESLKRSCLHLRMLVLLDYVLGASDSVVRGLNDRRVVRVITEVALHDWEPGAKSFHEWEIRMGEADMWARGEDIIQRNSS
ncbi:hypothetical protein B0H17DRAFT_1202331 [Mycena rosella]|uniref:Uncharacterized protein n=1 Tax=Mycena rosella TaxID=1033263 RepID=A0AAD7GDL8_MYCRO|nr:hypothetical protein B0H17DRAFT_1202331 [Mycena rosella]